MNWQGRTGLSSEKSRAKTWKGANNRWVKKILMAKDKTGCKIYHFDSHSPSIV